MNKKMRRFLSVVIFPGLLLTSAAAWAADAETLCGFYSRGELAACFGPVPVYVSAVDAWSADPQSYSGTYGVNTAPVIIEKIKVEQVKGKLYLIITYIKEKVVLPSDSTPRLTKTYEGSFEGNTFRSGSLSARFVVWNTRNQGGTPWPMQGIIFNDPAIWPEALFIRKYK